MPNDGFVKKAGGAFPAAIPAMTRMEDIKDSFQINFFSPLLLTQLLSKNMMRQRSGSIIFLSSSAAYDGGANIEYSAGKAAVIGAVRRLAVELGMYGIRVNAIAPGWVNTEMNQLLSDEFKEEANNDTLLHRFAEPSEIAKVVKFLASEDASYINATVIRVDGRLK